LKKPAASAPPIFKVNQIGTLLFCWLHAGRSFDEALTLTHLDADDLTAELAQAEDHELGGLPARC
jgi:hypothetical protein